MEKFSLGGLDRCTGHEESAVSGDLGYFAGVELLTPIYFLPENFKLNIPFQKNDLILPVKKNFKFSTFYQQGIVKDIHTNNEPFKFIQSIGTGLIISLNDYLNANLYIGIPIGPMQYKEQRRVKFVFSINSNIL
jgi:hemolysin activation/secretion protein